MRKSAHAFAAILALMLSNLAVAQQSDTAKSKLVMEKVAGSVYLLRGSSTNVAASIGEDGVVLVDTVLVKSPDANLSALRSVTDKPLRFVINTHCHSDHTGGNGAFYSLAPIIAHRNVRVRLETGTETCPKQVLPSITFDKRMTLHVNGEDIRLLTVPAAHTDGDIVVYFTKSKVVHVGDVLMSPGVSFPDQSNGGELLGLIAALEYVISQLPNDVKIIPGHGKVSSLSEMKQGLGILKEIEAFVREGLRDGESLEQLLQERESFGPWESQTVTGVENYIMKFYDELAAEE